MRRQEEKRRKPTHDDQSQPQTRLSISQLHGPPVAMRWYNLPHEGAHATEVMAYEVPEGTLVGSAAVEVSSGLTGTPVLEADEEGVASTEGQEGISPMRHTSLISHCDKISGTETKVTNSFLTATNYWALGQKCSSTYR